MFPPELSKGQTLGNAEVKGEKGSTTVSENQGSSCVSQKAGKEIPG